MADPLTTLRAALKQAAHAWAIEAYNKGLGRPCDIDGKRGAFDALIASMEAQPEQKPVAWMAVNKAYDERKADLTFYPKSSWFDNHEITPLYTHLILQPTEPSDEEFKQKIEQEFDRLGDSEGQGLHPYWKAAFREGANFARRYHTQPSVDAVRWAVGKWIAEVQNRPLANVHRRSLDDTWRTVIRHFGGDDSRLLPRHDDMVTADRENSRANVAIHAQPVEQPGKCAQCGVAYKPCASSKGCPKCAPGVQVIEAEFQKPLPVEQPAKGEA